MHIGQRIKEVMDEKRLSVIWLSKTINCERTNVYNIFSRKDISTSLLRKISMALGHDFFKEVSKDLSREMSNKK
jgi:hypothetical protein